MFLLVPVDLCGDHELPSAPAFLLDDPAELHLGPGARERLADVKEVDSVVECECDEILVHLAGRAL